MSTLAELGRTHELLWNLTCASCVLATSRVLGWAWSLVNPLATMLIYSFVFVTLLESTAPVGNPSGLQAYGLFILCAILPWNYMSVGVGTSMGSVLGNGGLVKKVAFPREHLVLATVAASLVTLLIEIAVLSVVLAFFGNIVILELPGVVLAAALLTMFVVGLSLFMSAANVFFRDMNHLWGILLQIWFFLTPVVYPPRARRRQTAYVGVLDLRASTDGRRGPAVPHIAVRCPVSNRAPVRLPRHMGGAHALGRLGSLQEAGTSIRGGAVSGDAVDGVARRRATSR